MRQGPGGTDETDPGNRWRRSRPPGRPALVGVAALHRRRPPRGRCGPGERSLGDQRSLDRRAVPRATLRGAVRGIPRGEALHTDRERQRRPPHRARGARHRPRRRGHRTRADVGGQCVRGPARERRPRPGRHRSRDVVPVGGGDAARAVAPYAGHLRGAPLLLDGRHGRAPHGCRGGRGPARRGLRAGSRRGLARRPGGHARHGRRLQHAADEGADGRGRRRGDHRQRGPRAPSRAAACRRAHVLSHASPHRRARAGRGRRGDGCEPGHVGGPGGASARRTRPAGEREQRASAERGTARRRARGAARSGAGAESSGSDASGRTATTSCGSTAADSAGATSIRSPGC